MKKVALITGASSGIGKELAYCHAKTGGDMVLIARSKDKLETLKSELETQQRVQVMVITKDLTLPDSPQEIHTEITNAGIQIDYLLNNAGFGGRGKFHERPWEKDLAMINLNIIALTALTRLFLPEMVQRNSGKILNVSSTASFMPGPLQAVYFATKAYVTYFSNALAEELHDTAITVTNLMPGATETEFAKTSGMDKTNLFDSTVSAKSVAQDGYKGMLEGKLDVISGLSTSQRIMMKMIPFTPKRVMLKQIRQMQEEK
ncbi:MAG: SDR family oxidoreductase [Bacteroidota bacterium]